MFSIKKCQKKHFHRPRPDNPLLQECSSQESNNGPEYEPARQSVWWQHQCESQGCQVCPKKSVKKTDFWPNVRHVCIYDLSFEFPQNALGLLNHGMNDKIQLHNQNNNLPDLRFAKLYLKRQRQRQKLIQGQRQKKLILIQGQRQRQKLILIQGQRQRQRQNQNNNPPDLSFTKPWYSQLSSSLRD